MKNFKNLLLILPQKTNKTYSQNSYYIMIRLYHHTTGIMVVSRFFLFFIRKCSFRFITRCMEFFSTKNLPTPMYQCTFFFTWCTRKTNIFDDSPSQPNIICFFLCSPGSAVVYPVDKIFFFDCVPAAYYCKLQFWLTHLYIH